MGLEFFRAPHPLADVGNGRIRNLPVNPVHFAFEFGSLPQLLVNVNIQVEQKH